MKQNDLISNIFFNTIKNSSIKFSDEELSLMLEYVTLNQDYSTNCLIKDHISRKLKPNHKIKLIKHSNMDTLINNGYFNICSEMELRMALNTFDIDICRLIITNISNESQLNKLSLSDREKFLDILTLKKLK